MIQLERVSTAEAIVKHLMEAIANGDYAPGEKLPSERRLQEMLGVGRLALREGMARLSALGIISIHHGKGAFVNEGVDGKALSHVLMPLFPQKNLKHLQDLVEARSMIEGEIAAHAAERRSDDDIQELAAILEYDAATLRDPQKIADCDYQFHSALARIGGNVFLEVMYEGLAPHIREFLIHYARTHKKRQDALERHRPILEAIRVQNIEEARDLARNHAAFCANDFKAYAEELQ